MGCFLFYFKLGGKVPVNSETFRQSNQAIRDRRRQDTAIQPNPHRPAYFGNSGGVTVAKV